MHSMYLQPGPINVSTFSRSFREWKYCQHEIDMLMHKDWMVCPPCHLDQHSVHIDGNMKLYRYNSAGGYENGFCNINGYTINVIQYSKCVVWFGYCV